MDYARYGKCKLLVQDKNNRNGYSTCDNKEFVKKAGKKPLQLPNYADYGGSLTKERLKELRSKIYYYDQEVKKCQQELDKAAEVGRKQFYNDIIKKL